MAEEAEQKATAQHNLGQQHADEVKKVRDWFFCFRVEETIWFYTEATLG